MRKLNFKYLGVAAAAITFGAFLTTNNVSAVDITTDYKLGTDAVKEASEGLIIKSGKTVVLDLNGKELTVAGKDAIFVENGAKLTIKGSGKITSEGEGFAAIFNNGGDITIDDGHFVKDEDKGTWYVVVNHGNMTINKGKFEFTKYLISSLIRNGYSDYVKNTNEREGYVAGKGLPAPKLVINGGEFIEGQSNVKNDEGGDLTINGGSFKITQAGNSTPRNIQNWNKGKITGGRFENPMSGNKRGVVMVGKYGAHAIGDLEVSGGEFIGDYIFAGFNEEAQYAGKIKISGGKFLSNEKLVSTAGFYDKDDGSPKAEFFSIEGGEYNDLSVSPSDGYVEITTPSSKKVILAKIANKTEEMELVEGERKAINLAKEALEVLIGDNTNPEFAKVEGLDMVGLKAGKTTVTWTLGGDKYILNVTVKEKAVAAGSEFDETSDTGVKSKDSGLMQLVVLGSAVLGLAMAVKFAKR